VDIPLLNPLYDAVAWVIMRLHALFGALFGPSSGWAWALTIAFLVIIMRLILLPLFIKQMHATRKMTALAPQVAELRKKYKNDRQKLNEETMKLYRENGANPLAGCLPVVAQLPVFFALFNVLRAISLDEPKYGLTPAVVHSAQTAHILGVTVADRFLSTLLPPTLFPGIGTSQRIVIILTVIVSATTTFLTVRQSMKRGMTPQVDPNNPMASSQKFMQYIVPVFALSGLYWQYGLVLYWVSTNLWTLGQQYVLFKRFPPPVPAGAAAGGAAAPAKPSGKPGGKGSGPAPAKPAGKVTAAGRAAARQQAPPPAKPAGQSPKPAAQAQGRPAKPAAAKGQPAKPSAQPAQASGQPATDQPAQPPASQSSRPPINQLRKASASQPANGSGKSASPPSKSASAKPASTSGKSAPAKPAAGKGAAGSNGGGGLRRLVRGRAEAEPPPADEPETKIVRQQPVRQSRSRRSGKR
jgi:YidC/Oxa1 family membrane protein insertase